MKKVDEDHNPKMSPGSDVSMCSSDTPAETPRNTTKKQVEPIRDEDHHGGDAHGALRTLLMRSRSCGMRTASRQIQTMAI